ncbi:uncharacterized protein LOC120889121 [Ictidomys tridecemlineatus]
MFWTEMQSKEGNPSGRERRGQREDEEVTAHRISQLCFLKKSSPLNSSLKEREHPKKKRISCYKKCFWLVHTNASFWRFSPLVISPQSTRSHSAQCARAPPPREAGSAPCSPSSPAAAAAAARAGAQGAVAGGRSRRATGPYLRSQRAAIGPGVSDALAWAQLRASRREWEQASRDPGPKPSGEKFENMKNASTPLQLGYF